MKRLLFAVTCLPFIIGASEQNCFNLSIKSDVIIIGTGLLLNGTGIFLEEINDYGFNKDYNLNSNDVFALDRLFMKPFNGTIDTASQVLTFCTLMSPSVLLSTSSTEWFKIGVMYSESLLLTLGLKELGKNIFTRYRPYMYFDNFPVEEVANGDYRQSFPSGHTALAFTGATFNTFVFNTYFKDSKWKLPVIAGSYSLATASAILRVSSGNHFVTDVIAGAIIGSLSGFIVPLMHLSKDEKSNFSFMVVPSGIYVSLLL